MKITLKVWRQRALKEPGSFETYQEDHVSPDMSFLEMIDVINERLVEQGKAPIAFDHDCREGICGTCGMVINGEAHGPRAETTTCQLHMREFKDGAHITIEPWRAKAFPILRDLIVDRGALDRVIQSGGFISVRTGSAPDAHCIPVERDKAEFAFEAAACIGCGACVAACPNASGMLFVSAKVSHLAALPQGQPERLSRAQNMVLQMDKEGFGACTSHAECEAVCPKGITLRMIAQMNRDFLRGMITSPVSE